MNLGPVFYLSRQITHLDLCVHDMFPKHRFGIMLHRRTTRKFMYVTGLNSTRLDSRRTD